MNADGTNQRIITTEDNMGAEVIDFTWSPDGSKILYTGYAQPQAVAEVNTMNADGTGVTPLGPGYDATYSPDGSKIVFIRIGTAVVNPANQFEYDLMQMNADGTGQSILVHSVYPSKPSFSADGRKIAFVTYTPNSNSNTDISVMNADGTGQTAIATGGYTTASKAAYNINPTFSPDGTKVAFESSRSVPPPGVFEDDEIWSVNVDGTSLTQLTFAVPLSTGISWNRYPAYGPGAVGQPVLISLAVNPSTLLSGGSAVGTVTLSGPATAGGAIVILSSASTSVGVPAAVTVPAGAVSATFPISTTTVSAVTVATITATYAVSQTAVLTLIPPDVLALTRAEYTVSQKQLRVQATSSSLVATLTVYDSATGAAIGTMTNVGGGKYQLQLTWPTTPAVVTIKSSKGGSVTGAVAIHN
jgi:hypothetical protein